MNETKYIVTSRHVRPQRNKSNFVREHVLVAEQKLGRQLTKNEVVHHIDQNKNNNSPENLIVFASNADHSSFHKGCEIYEINGVWYAKHKQLTCEQCGKVFDWYKGRKKQNHVYCSTECAKKASRLFEITKEDLQNLLLNENGNFLKVGKILGVSDNAVRKRCKLYGIPTHSSEYKMGH